MIQVFIVDDHPLVRDSLRAFLDLKPDLAVCGEASTAAEALARVHQARPDLVLVDMSLPDQSGIELVRMLRARHPELRLAMLSGHGERSHVDQALEAGACGYVLKGSTDTLPAALRRMAQGEQYLSAEVGGPRARAG